MKAVVFETFIMISQTFITISQTFITISHISLSYRFRIALKTGRG